MCRAISPIPKCRCWSCCRRCSGLGRRSLERQEQDERSGQDDYHSQRYQQHEQSPRALRPTRPLGRRFITIFSFRGRRRRRRRSHGRCDDPGEFAGRAAGPTGRGSVRSAPRRRRRRNTGHQPREFAGLFRCGRGGRGRRRRPERRWCHRRRRGCAQSLPVILRGLGVRRGRNAEIRVRLEEPRELSRGRPRGR